MNWSWVRKPRTMCSTASKPRLDDVLKKQTTGNIAIVTHGTVLALFIAAHSQRKPFDLWREMGLPSYVIFSLPEMNLLEVVSRLA